MIFFNKLVLLLFFFLIACSSKKDPISEKEYEPNVQKRQEEFLKKEGSILFGKKLGPNERPAADFTTSNIMWRATLKSLEFLPLINADYNGGIIIYDWYSAEQNNNEEIKITVNFLSNELRSNSIKIIAHKRTCEQNKRCQITQASENFSSEIKNSVLASARIMKIEEEKNKNK